MTIDNNEELQRFLEYNFASLKLEQPLFYGWTYAVRLATKECYGSNDQIRKSKLAQALAWFKALFAPDEQVLIVNDYRKKVGLLPVLQKEASNIQSVILSQQCDYHGRILVTGRDIALCSTSHANVSNIFNAIINKSYGGEPVGSVYFINLDKKIIFDFYAESGADIIASLANELHSFYQEFAQDIPLADRARIKHNLGI